VFREAEVVARFGITARQMADLLALMGDSSDNVPGVKGIGDKTVARRPIEVEQPFEPALPDGSSSGIEVLPFEVPGKGAWYLEGKAHPAGAGGAGDTLGLRIADKASGQYFYFIAACARVTEELKERIRDAPLVFFDGTVWRDDELIAAGLGRKTGQSMGHVSMSGDHGAIEHFTGLDIARKVFLHINNSNPAWLKGSDERRALERAGWEIPADGTEIVL
jgi:pyrroloquinoline quinone biosynthesis protein B